jgi:hypothetical protein
MILVSHIEPPAIKRLVGFVALPFKSSRTKWPDDPTFERVIKALSEIPKYQRLCLCPLMRPGFQAKSAIASRTSALQYPLLMFE